MLCSRDLAWTSVFVRSIRSSASLIISARYHLLLVFLSESHFLLLDLLTFIVCNLVRLQTYMALMYLLARLQ